MLIHEKFEDSFSYRSLYEGGKQMMSVGQYEVIALKATFD